MALQWFNTLSRSVEPFVPLDPKGLQVGLYCCGPTVYDFGHIGNFRTFVFADLVRRYLEFCGYEVRHVMNITDVEDKIIRNVRESGETLTDFTARYEKAFLEDMKVLKCLEPHVVPRATDAIPDIIELIERLVERGIAYQASDGSVYFNIEKYQGCGCRYGQLVNLNFDQMRPGERVSQDEYDKESVADFALWKARVPEDGEVFWPSPWGEGRPGWHIECSAMSMRELGPSFDLHLGGEDLVFPHHEDEIAQSEGAAVQPDGQRFVKYWLHGAHLLVEGKKMSKSLGNFFTLRDLLDKGSSGREIRYLLLTSHYRETFNFTLSGLDGARAALGRLDECVGKLRELAVDEPEPGVVADPGVLEEFRKALDNDLNISAAWGVVFDWVRGVNRALAEKNPQKDWAAAQLKAWKQMDSVLAVEKVEEPAATIPAEVLGMLDERQAARKSRDFAQADALRDQLKTLGWVIEDTPKGPKLKSI